MNSRGTGLYKRLKHTVRTTVTNFISEVTHQLEQPRDRDNPESHSSSHDANHDCDHCICPSLKISSKSEEFFVFNQMCSTKKCSWVIPFGGNAFVTSILRDDGRGAEDEEESIISDCGIVNWTDPTQVISTFFHSIYPGHVQLVLRLRVPDNGRSKIKVTLSHAKPPAGKTVPRMRSTDNEIDDGVTVIEDGSGKLEQVSTIEVTGTKWQLVPCGIYLLPLDGYIRLDLQGIDRNNEFFADMTHILVFPESDWFTEDTCVKFVADPNDFYFGRRGPSVHLRYLTPPKTDFEYFYTELKVPEGQDVIGSYFCAAGFRGGYFGIQVNSATERRILFSIWSEWNSDNPGDVPEDYKVTLLKKGENVKVGNFGDEGTGAQSYLVYPWVSEQTYRFLVFATKMGTDRTVYTAWFNPTEDAAGWRIIASFMKPKDSTFLQDLYAFSENFVPEQGHIERLCLFGNQWVCDTEGKWHEITGAEFTVDATAKEGRRMDVCGGVHESSGHFFLRNCGFFSDSVEPHTPFERKALNIPPQIDFVALP